MGPSSAVRRSTVQAMLLACLALLIGAALTAGAAPLHQEDDPVVADGGQSDGDTPLLATPTALLAPAFHIDPSGRIHVDANANHNDCANCGPDARADSNSAHHGRAARTDHRVVQLTNAERAKKGLPPLQPNPNLMRAAQDYAAVLAPGPCFEHDCPPVPSPVARAANAGYANFVRLGENLAAGDDTPAAAVRAWMESPAPVQYPEAGVSGDRGGGEHRRRRY